MNAKAKICFIFSSYQCMYKRFESSETKADHGKSRNVLFAHIQLCKLQDKLAKKYYFYLLKHQKNNVVFLGVQDVENSKPVFDPDFPTKLIIKDQYEDCNSGNLDFCKTRDLEIIFVQILQHR